MSIHSIFVNLFALLSFALPAFASAAPHQSLDPATTKSIACSGQISSPGTALHGGYVSFIVQNLKTVDSLDGTMRVGTYSVRVTKSAQGGLLYTSRGRGELQKGPTMRLTLDFSGSPGFQPLAMNENEVFLSVYSTPTSAKASLEFRLGSSLGSSTPIYANSLPCQLKP